MEQSSKEGEKMNPSEPFVKDYRPYALGLISARSMTVDNWKLDKSGKMWHRFYNMHGRTFFKDRHYLSREWPLLSPEATRGTPRLLVECGCGAGATAFTLLESNPDLHVVGFDYALSAIRLCQNDPRMSQLKDRCFFFVHSLLSDGASVAFPLENLKRTSLSASRAHFATLIFVLSAIKVPDMGGALRQIWEILEVGGVLFFRDYCVGDFKEGDFLEEDESGSVYREDGTRSYFFSKEKIQQLAADAGFVVLSCELVGKELVNRKLELNMERRFIQAALQKTA
eukprot:ANDGO_06721.mRNA.1 putative methyltransferase C3H7.11